MTDIFDTRKYCKIRKYSCGTLRINAIKSGKESNVYSEKNKNKTNELNYCCHLLGGGATLVAVLHIKGAVNIAFIFSFTQPGGTGKWGHSFVSNIFIIFHWATSLKVKLRVDQWSKTTLGRRGG